MVVGSPSYRYCTAPHRHRPVPPLVVDLLIDGPLVSSFPSNKSTHNTDLMAARHLQRLDQFTKSIQHIVSYVREIWVRTVKGDLCDAIVDTFAVVIASAKCRASPWPFVVFCSGIVIPISVADTARRCG